MRSVCLIAILLIVSAGYCAAADQRPDEIAYNVSIIRLIASPEKYHGKRVVVWGFLRLEFEGDTLYLHREDYERSLTANGIHLSLSESQRKPFKKYDRQYVVLSGVFFRCDETKLVCVFSGHLSDIDSRLDFWPLRPNKSLDEPRR